MKIKKGVHASTVPRPYRRNGLVSKPDSHDSYRTRMQTHADEPRSALNTQRVVHLLGKEWENGADKVPDEAHGRESRRCVCGGRSGVSSQHIADRDKQARATHRERRRRRGMKKP
jgi:hypothetical protein